MDQTMNGRRDFGSVQVGRHRRLARRLTDCPEQDDDINKTVLRRSGVTKSRRTSARLRSKDTTGGGEQSTTVSKLEQDKQEQVVAHAYRL